MNLKINSKIGRVAEIDWKTNITNNIFLTTLMGSIKNHFTSSDVSISKVALNLLCDINNCRTFILNSSLLPITAPRSLEMSFNSGNMKVKAGALNGFFHEYAINRYWFLSKTNVEIEFNARIVCSFRFSATHPGDSLQAACLCRRITLAMNSPEL